MKILRKETFEKQNLHSLRLRHTGYSLYFATLRARYYPGYYTKISAQNVYLFMQAVIFFDGVCNLCNGAIQFIIKRDKQNIFRFAALQSDYAQKILPNYFLTAKQTDSIVLIENGKIYQQSTAALKIAKKLSGFWPLLYIFIIVPKFIRDAVYNYIAKNRYKWFGKQESCWVPTPELREKFF